MPLDMTKTPSRGDPELHATITPLADGRFEIVWAQVWSAEAWTACSERTADLSWLPLDARAACYYLREHGTISPRMWRLIQAAAAVVAG